MTISPNLLETFIDAPDEKDLALAFKRGEKGAYQTIHETYAPRVHGVCRRMLVSREDAEEAAQETFLRVYQALGRFNGRYQLGAWITRIATNVCLDHLRSRSRKPKFAEATAELMDLQTNLDYEDSEPETLMIRDSESRQVRRVLASLPPMHRAAIVLREYEGLSYEEIAAALGITDCQVKALIHRARQNFKKSWVRQVAQALAPAGFFSRVRRWATFGRDTSGSTSAQIAEVVTPSMHTVASCATFAQQCGQAFAERLAPVAVAFLLGGSATVGTAALALEGSHDESRGTMQADSMLAPTSGTEPRNRAADSLRPGHGFGASTSDADASQQEAPDQAAPPVPPGSTTDDPGTPTAPPSGGTAPAPTQSPSVGSGVVPGTPSPSPQPFVAWLGVAGGGGTRTAPQANSYDLDCVGKTLQQTLRASFWNGNEEVPAMLTVDGQGARASIELVLTKNNSHYAYRSWGPSPVVDWDEAVGTLDVSGSLGPAFGYDPAASGLPVSGSFVLHFDIECGSSTFRGESLTLTE